MTADTDFSSRVARVSVSTCLCPSDLGWSAWTNYAGNCGIGIQKYGYNGIIGPAAVGYQSVRDGTSQTAAFSEFVMGEWKSHDPRRVVYSIATLRIRPEEFDQFTEECRGLNPETADIKHDERGATWINAYILSTLYNHANPINAKSCMTGPLMQQGAWSAGSLHPGGANVLFADGHVHFQGDSISPDVWRAVGSRNGSEPVALE
jgi:prepilin-type processing-associated H-X9-DG protein